MDEELDKKYRKEYGEEWDEMNFIEKEEFSNLYPLEYKIKEGEFLYYNNRNFYHNAKLFWEKINYPDKVFVPDYEGSRRRSNLIRLLEFRVSFLDGINKELRKKNKILQKKNDKLEKFNKFDIMDI